MDKETTAFRPFDRLLDVLHSVPPEKQDEIAEAILRQIQDDADFGAEGKENQKWEETLQSPESVAMLDEMARKSRAEYYAGRTISTDEFLDRYPE